MSSSQAGTARLRLIPDGDPEHVGGTSPGVPTWAVPRPATRIRRALEPLPAHRGPAGSSARSAATAPTELLPEAGAPGSHPRRALHAVPASAASTGAQPSPGPEATARALAAGVAEALSGRVSAHHLGRLVDLPTLEKISRRIGWELGTLQPGASVPRPTPAPRVGVQRLNEDSAECWCLIGVGERLRSMAFRLEQRRGRWRATALELG